LQPEAKDMSPEYPKKTFRDRPAFQGCINTIGHAAYGSVEKTVDYCRKTM